MPENWKVLYNLSTGAYKAGEYQKSIEYGESALRYIKDNGGLYSNLAACSAHLGLTDKAVSYGNRALEIRDFQQKAHDETWTPPHGTPSEFARSDDKRNIIAFSLWGDDIRYLRGAVSNALLAPKYYPDWEIHFHVDDSVPTDCLNLLDKLGAQCLKHPRKDSTFNKLCWRFLASDAPGAGYFIVRDADAVFSKREAEAVNEWLNSDKWFHVMRDAVTHTDLMLAGMWGGVAGVLPPMQQMLNNFILPNVAMANLDQVFLEKCVWAYVRKSCMVHDRHFTVPRDSRPFPGPLPLDQTSVGRNEFIANRKKQLEFIVSMVGELPFLRVEEG